MKYDKSKSCKILNISRSNWYRLNQEKKVRNKKDDELNKELLEKLKVIKTEHLFWGYRQCWAHLKRRQGYKNINAKRIYLLMKKNGLLVVKNKIVKRNNTIMKSKPKAKEINDWWGTDMSKCLIDGVGWMYVTVVKDWWTKEIIGYNISIRCRTEEWLQALNMAVNNACFDGSRNYKINLMSDNGSQPTSRAYMKSCNELGINQSFTAYGNPKGNGDTERFFKTLKEECVWANEWTSYNEAKSSIEKAIYDYNNFSCMGILKYLSPVEFKNSLAVKRKTA